MRPSGRQMGVVLGVWGVAVAAGFLGLVRHSVTPGVAAAAEARWPAQATSLRPSTQLTLIVAVHPGCPCSKVSIAELGELLARHPRTALCYVLFEPGEGASPDECRQSALWHAASALPDTSVLVDTHHLGTTVFGARTSGQVLAYDGGGLLRFSGGVTAARDHAGDSDGQDAIEALLSGRSPAHAQTPVYGCGL